MPETSISESVSKLAVWAVSKCWITGHWRAASLLLQIPLLLSTNASNFSFVRWRCSADTVLDLEAKVWSSIWFDYLYSVQMGLPVLRFDLWVIKYSFIKYTRVYIVHIDHKILHHKTEFLWYFIVFHKILHAISVPDILINPSVPVGPIRMGRWQHWCCTDAALTVAYFKVSFIIVLSTGWKTFLNLQNWNIYYNLYRIMGEGKNVIKMESILTAVIHRAER